MEKEKQKEQKNTINNALEVLDSALQKGGEDITKLVKKENFRKLSRAMSEANSEVSDSINSGASTISSFSKEQAERISNEARKGVRAVDETAQKHPWYFSLGAFTLGGLLAFYLTRPKK